MPDQGPFMQICFSKKKDRPARGGLSFFTALYGRGERYTLTRKSTAMMEMTEFTDGLRFVSTITWHGIILSAIQGAVLYLATVLGLKRGLNLE